MALFFTNTNSLRVRFALGFSILVTLFLAITFVFIYQSFSSFRKDEFYERIKNKALTTFKLLVEVEQIDHDLLKVIDKNTLNNLQDEKVLIYKDSILIYSSIDDKSINSISELFNQLRSKDEHRTTQGADEILGLRISQNTGDYYIIASAYDKYGRTKMKFLKWVMIIVYCCGLFIGWVTTYFFVKRVIQPLEKLKKQLADVNYTTLDVRLPTTGQGEEVNSLSTTFNQMMSSLQQSFNFQRDFIHYASHELRTPLAAMISLTENSLNKKMSQEELVGVLSVLFKQQKDLTNITNSLLLLADNTNKLAKTEYPKIRLDELVFRSVDIVRNIYNEPSIEINLEGELANENSLLIHGNEPLILMAFNNLLKNALQYSSDNKVTIVLRVTKDGKEVIFLNEGRPFTDGEEERIFIPFYRASNASRIGGHGLGLPLVKQIVGLHEATISYAYKGGHNEFKITFY